MVVIYDENISFDHYFGTYPFATNPPGEPQFHALPGTPSVNGLNDALLTANPNLNLPQRLGPDQAITCDQNHGYSAEQAAFDSGLMDKFVQDTTGGGCTQSTFPDSSSYGPNGIVMDYYDGNTVTALWNLAQHFTLNDNNYNTQFGPSSPGAINLVSGQTNGAVAHGGTSSNIANGTLIGDAEPLYDQCSNASTPLNADGTPGGVTASMTGRNIGDLMNTAGVTWGWFQGGFTPSSFQSGRAICGTQHANLAGALQNDYVEHHEPFQYYASTANPNHISPASVSNVGVSDPAGTPMTQAVNHQYDLAWFFKALSNGNMPQVSFLKPPAYQNGHAGNSDPLDEQQFLVNTINAIEQSPDWSSTAIVIDYDDSDGWYDHQMGPIIRQSLDVNDALTGPGKCGSGTTPPAQNDRCGVGPRTPMLVISPYARQNFVDNTFTEQASIPRFIEDNWNLGRIGNSSADASAGTLMNSFDFTSSKLAPAIIMNPDTGEVVKTIPTSGGGNGGGGNGGETWGGNGGGGNGGGGNGGNGGGGSGHSPSGTDGGSGSSNSAGSSSGSSGAGAGKAGMPGTVRFSCHQSAGRLTVTLNCSTGREAQSPAMVRARLYHGKHLVRNVASPMHEHHVKLTMRLGRDAARGRYTTRVAVDAAGSVAAWTRSVRVR